MSQSRRRVLCIFCDERKPRAREDVISEWMSDELNPTGTVYTDFITELPGVPLQRRSKKSGNLATLKLRDVCVDCNGGWMSRLENATKPILLPMLRGVAGPLNLSEQRQLAAWCQLKCLTLDAFYRGEHDGVRHLPARLTHDFYRERQPLENSLVVLGRYLPPKQGVFMPWGRLMKEYPADGVRPAASIVIVTFAFGHLALQVLVGAWQTPHAAQIHFPYADPRFLRIWPSEQQAFVRWPPNVAISVSDFAGVAGPGTRVSSGAEPPMQNGPGVAFQAI